MEMRKQTNRRRAAELLISMTVAVFMTFKGGNAKAQTAGSSVTTSPINQTQPALRPSSSTTQVTALSLREAIQLSIANNLDTRLAGERRNEAVGAKIQALAALLPNVSASASQASNTVNLAAQGLTPKVFPIPTTLVGPFNSFDARFQFAQSVFNLSSIRNFQSAQAGARLAELQEKLAREQVASLAALAYLNALRSQGDVGTAQANLNLAKSLLALANNQKNAGIATGVDVTRAETRVADQETRLAQAETAQQTEMVNLLTMTWLRRDCRRELVLVLKFVAQLAGVVHVKRHTPAQ